MADKTYSEDEHIAILSDRVKQETANLTAQVAERDATITELQNKLDVETSAKTAAEQRADEAEKALADFKAETEEREAASARKEERLTKVREAASHMGEDFLKDEKRVDRIVAMSDDQFDGYLEDLGATGKAAPGNPPIPRETAMSGATPSASASKSAARSVLLGYAGLGQEN